MPPMPPMPIPPILLLVVAVGAPAVAVEDGDILILIGGILIADMSMI